VLETQVPFRQNRFLHLLIAAMFFVLAVSAYHPTMVFDWFLENLLVLVLVSALIVSYKSVPLSRTSYLLIFCYLCLHEWGAHYKYDGVPLGEWIKTWLQTPRNHYDRVLHFSFGLFLGYPMMEAYTHLAGVRNLTRYWFPMEAALAFGAFYEIIEAIVAKIVSPEHGEAFVGMQGDMWDAQQDMGLGFAGAGLAMAITFLAERLRQKNAPAHNN
jgi:putative membrane protein